MANKSIDSRKGSDVIDLINKGRYTEALPLLKKLCKSSPRDSEAWLLLGIAHGGLGVYNKAAGNFINSIKLNPGLAEGHYYLARALQAQGKTQHAIKSYRKATELRPDYWEAHYGIARVLQQSGKLEAAVTTYQKAIAINPQNSELHANLALACKALGRNSLAVVSLKEAIRLQPDSAEVHFNLGNLHQGQRELDEAEACYRKATQLKPGWISAHLALYRTLLLQGEVDKALDGCRRLLAGEPGEQAVIAMEACILERVGDLEGAHKRLKTLIESGTCQADALITYAKLASHLGNHSEIIALLEDRLGSGAFDREDAKRLHFALADTYDAVEDYNKAFSHYQKGNALKSGKFIPNEWLNSVDTIVKHFSAELLESRGHATNQSRLPVFIVGMPRTGSTLLEQSLSRHSGIYGAGELPDIKNIALLLPGLIGTDLRYPECLAGFDQPVIDRVANDHLKRLDRLSKGALRAIDKMPGNYLHLGLIQILFPRATILHTVRDPIDTCLSCFTRDLGGGASFSADLKSLGSFYKGYRRLMDHWKDILQIEILDVRYEELIEDYETIVRGVIEFCGLGWEEQCLDRLGNRRVVATPSYNQIRKPLYKSSVGKWKHYEVHLGPLIESLES